MRLLRLQDIASFQNVCSQAPFYTVFVQCIVQQSNLIWMKPSTISNLISRLSSNNNTNLHVHQTRQRNQHWSPQALKGQYEHLPQLRASLLAELCFASIQLTQSPALHMRATVKVFAIDFMSCSFLSDRLRQCLSHYLIIMINITCKGHGTTLKLTESLFVCAKGKEENDWGCVSPMPTHIHNHNEKRRPTKTKS